MKICLFLVKLGLILGLVVILSGVFELSPSLAANSTIASTIPVGMTANIQGEVIDQTSGVHLAGARVSIPSLHLETVTSLTGNFSWNNILIDRDPAPADVVVSAPGYGNWLLNNALLRRGDTLILTVEMSKSPSPLYAPDFINSSGFLSSDLSLDSGFALTTFNDPLPATIRVGITGNIFCTPFITSTYTVNTVDFKTYVKHVLPNEWLYTWGRESLRAGAVAVKMYAWYWIEHGGKWRGTDMIDSTCDQVYNPAVEYASTNQAVDFTWNWKLTRQGDIFQTSHKDMDNCSPPICLNQSESAAMAAHGYTWDQILAHFYPGSALSLIDTGVNSYVLRFNGVPGDGPLANRVEFPLIDARQPDISLPINVGAGDFTLEWWMKVAPGDNNSGPVSCGENQNWNRGNILFDRSLSGPGGQYGISLARNRLVFGVTSPGGESLTLCGARPLADNGWHHIAVERRRADGMLWMFVDGRLDGFGAGPQGDISYPAGNSGISIFDPVLFLGGGKMYSEALPHPFFRGWIDELRFSSVLRYPPNGSFQPAKKPFNPDLDTLALYHFDDGLGYTVTDSTAFSQPSTGRDYYGGKIPGPEWTPADLFINYSQFIPLILSH